MDIVELVEQGGLLDLRSGFLSRAPIEGDIRTLGLITMSRLKSAEAKKGLIDTKDLDRKGFAKLLAETLRAIEKRRGDAIKADKKRYEKIVPAIAVFTEPHGFDIFADGLSHFPGMHFHAIVDTDVDWGHWHEIQTEMRQKKIAVDVRCAYEEEANSREKIIQYLTMPTEKKWITDATPFLSPNFKFGMRFAEVRHTRFVPP